MTRKGRGDKPKAGVPPGRRRLSLKKETLKDLGTKKDQKVRGGVIGTGQTAACVTPNCFKTIVCATFYNCPAPTVATCLAC